MVVVIPNVLLSSWSSVVTQCNLLLHSLGCFGLQATFDRRIDQLKGEMSQPRPQDALKRRSQSLWLFELWTSWQNSVELLSSYEIHVRHDAQVRYIACRCSRWDAQDDRPTDSWAESWVSLGDFLVDATRFQVAFLNLWNISVLAAASGDFCHQWIDWNLNKTSSGSNSGAITCWSSQVRTTQVGNFSWQKPEFRVIEHS